MMNTSLYEKPSGGMVSNKRRDRQRKTFKLPSIFVNERYMTSFLVRAKPLDKWFVLHDMPSTSILARQKLKMQMLDLKLISFVKKIALNCIHCLFRVCMKLHLLHSYTVVL